MFGKLLDIGMLKVFLLIQYHLSTGIVHIIFGEGMFIRGM